MKLRKGYFPEKVAKYLAENGESKNEEIRRALNFDESFKSDIYSDRSNYYFACLIVRMMKGGLVERTRRGYYKLVD